jgi:hypothetical protein
MDPSVMFELMSSAATTVGKIPYASRALLSKRANNAGFDTVHKLLSDTFDVR